MGAIGKLAVSFTRKAAKFRPGLVAGCSSLAVLSACAGGHNSRTAAESTSYYLSHAAHNYNPPGPPSDPWGPYIKDAAAHFDVPAMWIRQVMRVESGGHEYSGGHLIVSSAGAMGLMQLEPGTYQEMADRYGLGNDPFNPYDNIMAGAAYIHEMYQIYGSPGFLAAYNAGPGRLDSFINYHRPLPSETINYVAMIAPNIGGYYPRRRSAADELALNTEPMGRSGGILPDGFTPVAPTASQLSAPVEVASLAPRAGAEDDSPAPVSIPISSIMPAPVQTAQIQTQTITPEQAPPQAIPAPAPQRAQIPVRVASASTSSIYAPNALPVPPPAPPPVIHRTEVAFASQALPAPPPPPARHGFSLVPSAMAATLPTQPVDFNSGKHSWGIQVGAYDSSSNAKAALGMAELTGAQILMKAQPMVMTIHTGDGTKYRARFVGLHHDEAVNACNRLSTGPTGCVILSPDAQS